MCFLLGQSSYFVCRCCSVDRQGGTICGVTIRVRRFFKGMSDIVDDVLFNSTAPTLPGALVWAVDDFGGRYMNVAQRTRRHNSCRPQEVWQGTAYVNCESFERDLYTDLVKGSNRASHVLCCVQCPQEDTDAEGTIFLRFWSSGGTGLGKRTLSETFAASSRPAR